MDDAVLCCVVLCRVSVLLPAGVLLSCMVWTSLMRTSMTIQTTSHASSNWQGGGGGAGGLEVFSI
jgi:hypothetical protein